MHFELAHDANDVLVHVYDSEGNLIKTIEAGSLNAGEQTVEWDGTDNEGNQVSDGTYTFEVVATDTDGNTINATTFITALVSGVSFKDGTTYLLAGDQEIAIGSVFRVMET
jgi:flagellar basal-body rod modification protein FlgD